MPETSITLWEGAKWLLVFLASFIGWNLKVLSGKVDKHDREHIGRKEFNATLGALRNENREDFQRIHDKLDNMKP